jgi:hypothetical protein
MATVGTGRTVTALEHLPDWAAFVTSLIDRTGWNHVEVLHRPLETQGAFQWYDVLARDLPRRIGLLLVDGPPSDTVGGRVGALRVLRRHLDPESVILLDDWQRSSEQAVVAIWDQEFGVETEPFGPEGRLVRVRLRDLGA